MPTDRSRSCRGDFAHADGLGRRGPHARRARQRRHAGRRRAAARKFGAEGIGLCRTEHMFFEGDRIARGARDDPRRRRGRPPRGAGQAAADAARRTSSRSVRDHGGPAGHDPPARSAAARVPAARRQAEIEEVAPRDSACRSEKLARARPRARTSSTRCSAIAAAASASPIPRSTEMQARAIFEAAAEVQQEGRQDGRSPRS